MSGSTPSCIRDPLSFNSSLPSKSSPAHGSTMALGPSVTGATANPPIQNLQVASTPMRNEIQATSFSRPGRSSTAASSIQGPLDLTATLSPANGQNSQSLDSDTPTPSQATIAAWWSRVKLDRLPASEMETGTSSSITGPTRQPGHGGSREIEEQTLFSGTPTGPGNRGRDTSIHRQPGRREGSPSIRRSPSWADSPPSFRRSPSPSLSPYTLSSFSKKSKSGIRPYEL
ncbi:hypothetical protein BT96DRAFT_312795 [Gymnopus androsaceus JB14]|uniref:Uncharacterized protein n=1 Tax=Gymnopus androsaceus JB14 TaxID=1447944 RepID=A0A6A4I4G8_9AGAR|nr:hypothetical protein BT96DRAFT_312795 [Gymnopus androsaceus JB14]